MSGVYLRDTVGDEVNFRDRTVQLTRAARALKLWLSIRVFGLAAFREAIAHGIALAEHAEATLRARPGWEVVSPAQLAIVCFRREGVDQTRLAAAMVDDGFAAPSTTELGGRVVAAPVHHQSAHDVRRHRAHDRADGGGIRILRLS